MTGFVGKCWMWSKSAHFFQRRDTTVGLFTVLSDRVCTRYVGSNSARGRRGLFFASKLWCRSRRSGKWRKNVPILYIWIQLISIWEWTHVPASLTPSGMTEKLSRPMSLPATRQPAIAEKRMDPCPCQSIRQLAIAEKRMDPCPCQSNANRHDWEAK